MVKDIGFGKYILVLLFLFIYVSLFQSKSFSTFSTSSLTDNSVKMANADINVGVADKVTATVTRAKQPYLGGLVWLYNYEGNHYWGKTHKLVLYGIPTLLIVFLGFDFLVKRDEEVHRYEKDKYSYSSHYSGNSYGWSDKWI